MVNLRDLPTIVHLFGLKKKTRPLQKKNLLENKHVEPEKMEAWKMMFLCKGVIFRFHIIFFRSLYVGCPLPETKI